jgi:hypothetical protein
VRALFFIAVAALLVGCHHRRPAVSDAEFKEFKAAYPGMTQRCLDAYHYGGIVAWRPNDPDCFEMMPPQRWSGLWETGSEWTNFCSDPATECDWMAKRGTWLVFAKGTHFLGSDQPDGTYRIEFIGRRTKVPGNFGHQAAYDHLMVVDRLISISKVPERRQN